MGNQPLTNLSDIIGCIVSIQEPRRGRNETEDEAIKHNHLILVRDHVVIATVSRDDLFDPFGNRFYDD